MQVRVGRNTYKASTKSTVVLGIGITMKPPLKLVFLIEPLVLIVTTTLVTVDPLILIGNE